MDSDKTKHLIDLLKSLTDAKNPVDSEPIVLKVLCELLSEEGYEIKTAVRTERSEFDAVASKAHSPNHLEQIPIEYKHYRQPAVGAEGVDRILQSLYKFYAYPSVIVAINTRFTHAARQKISQNYPSKIQLIDIDELNGWVHRLEEVKSVDLDAIEVLRVGLSRQLIDLIINNSANLRAIEWREMERILAELFEGLGFNVILTPGSKDGGKDLILTARVSNAEHTYYVEVKHWCSQTKVGTKALREFINVIVNEEINGGLYLSTFGYCSNAIETLTEIERNKVRFGDELKVVELCKSYVKAKSGLFTPENLISEVIHSNTK